MICQRIKGGLADRMGGYQQNKVRATQIYVAFLNNLTN